MRRLLLTLGVLLLASLASGQREDERYVPDNDPLVAKNLEHWQDLKFGLLMHWGPYSQWGVVESWSICPEDEDWCRRNIPDYAQYKRAYEGLQTTFNPVGFDPAKWAAAARDAGMKYVVFTTKHHDGFCMFDSKYTDYKITGAATPFHTNPHANVTREIFDAFRRQGFLVGAYFSKPDWHSPDYWWPNFPATDRNVNYDPARYPDRWNRYVEFTHNQVLELLSDYGKVDILWLDGGWVAKKSKADMDREYQARLQESKTGFLKARIVDQDIHMDDLVVKARAKQPGLIVVDRAVHGKNQNYLTPENRVPDKALPYPWESCIISGGGWSFTPTARYMKPNAAVHLLADIVSKGGNLLLNIAPGPDGTWQQGAYDLLKAMGAWMAVNSEAIYETRAIAPYKEGKVCMTRRADGSTYFLYLADEQETTMPTEIRVTSYKPAAGAGVTLLGSKTRLAWKAEGNGFVVTIPESLRANPPCQHAWVLKMSK